MYTVNLYLKVRLACRAGMSQRKAARHFNVSRDSVAKMLAMSAPPGDRRQKPIKRPKVDGDHETYRKHVNAHFHSSVPPPRCSGLVPAIL